jgi:transposase
VVIDWLREASLSAAAGADVGRGGRDHGPRAVERWLDRRGETSARRIGLEKTSFQKRHEYVTVVTDLDGRRMLSVL